MDESQPISRLLSHDAASNSNELEYGLKTTPKGVNEYAVLYYGTWRPVESNPTNQPSVVYRSNKNLNLQIKLLFIVLWGVFFVFLVIALLVLLL